MPSLQNGTKKPGAARLIVSLKYYLVLGLLDLQSDCR